MNRRTLLVFLVALSLLGAISARAGFNKADGGIEFTYEDPYAGTVALAGEFNDWSMNAAPMTMDEEGVWRVVVDLKPGAYEYKFVVNGSEWIADPDNPVVVGDYGNSQITVNEDGEPVIGGGVPVISNTAVNSRVSLNGWYRATYVTRTDTPSDPRWRLSRPEHEFYVAVNPTVNSQVSGSAMVRLATGTGDIKEIHADIYSGHLTLAGDPFGVMGFYNEELVQFDNPLEAIGHRDLEGTIPEEHIAFGRGAQGLIASVDLWGVAAKGVYANTYDYDVMNRPSDYDNTDTDLVAARLKRPVGPVTIGATYRSWRDGWWISWLGSNESPHLDEYISETGSTSNWFELANTDQMIGLDLSMPVANDRARLAVEGAYVTYSSVWDMGNRERVEGEDYSNGEIDVTAGETEGWTGAAVIEAGVGPFDTRTEFTGLWLNAMDDDEEVVGFDSPWWVDLTGAPIEVPAIRQYTEVRYAGSPLTANVYSPSPKLEVLAVEWDGGVSIGILSLGAELDYADFSATFPDTVVALTGYDGIDGDWMRLAGNARADIYEGRTWWEFLAEYRKHDINAEEFWGALDSVEGILRGEAALNDDWRVLLNLRYIRYIDADEFFTPYVGVSYRPRKNMEFRVGAGVDPMNYVDTPVEGRPNGRERWRSEYLWEHGEHGLLDAEEALEDGKIWSAMAVILF